jgi:ankyrin repeat protein
MEWLLNAQKCDGNTPLHLAALENHVDMIDLLVSKGGDVSLKNRNELTALQLAQKHQRNDAVLKLNTISTTRRPWSQEPL